MVGIEGGNGDFGGVGGSYLELVGTGEGLGGGRRGPFGVGWDKRGSCGPGWGRRVQEGSAVFCWVGLGGIGGSHGGALYY